MRICTSAGWGNLCSGSTPASLRFCSQFLTDFWVCSTSVRIGKHHTRRRGVLSGERRRCMSQPSVTPAVLPDPVGAMSTSGHSSRSANSNCQAYGSMPSPNAVEKSCELLGVCGHGYWHLPVPAIPQVAASRAGCLASNRLLKECVPCWFDISIIIAPPTDIFPPS